MAADLFWTPDLQTVLLWGDHAEPVSVGQAGGWQGGAGPTAPVAGLWLTLAPGVGLRPVLSVVRSRDLYSLQPEAVPPWGSCLKGSAWSESQEARVTLSSLKLVGGTAFAAEKAPMGFKGPAVECSWDVVR